MGTMSQKLIKTQLYLIIMTESVSEERLDIPLDTS